MKTYKQKCKELEACLTNNKTGRIYQTDAEQLFTTVALIEQALRNNEIEMAKIYAQGMLQELGFDLVDILTNKCLLDGAYSE